MPLQPQPTRAALTGQTVDQYRIMEMIGRGGMGEVYRAHDERLNRSIAVKALPQQMVDDEIARKRFIRETRLASKVIHPYAATVFDVVEHRDQLLLVMELIEGRKLSSMLRESRPDLQTAVGYGTEIAEALTAIHEAGLAHRDLKPGNVMITRENHVKVMDFGLARQAPPVDPSGSAETARASDSTITRTGAGVGTVLYMSPEQLRGELADARSDLFAFGVLLYEMVAGSHPFAKQSVHESVAAILHEPPGGDSEPDTLTQSGPLRGVIMRLLEKEPESRYQKARELTGDLRVVAEGATLLPPEAARRRRRLRTIVSSVTLAVVALAASGYWWLTRPPVWESPRFTIAVVPFADHTGEPDGRLKGIMLADLLASDMSASRVVRVVGPADLAPLLKHLDADATPRQVADVVSRGAAVDYVLFGSLYREDDRYVAITDLVSAGAESTDLPTLQAAGMSALVLADELGTSLRRALPGVSRLTAWRDDRTDLEEITSESEEARELYTRGMVALQEGRYTEAIDWLERSVEVDSDFAVAHAELANALHTVGYGRRAREAASRAVSLVSDPRSAAEERLALVIAATRANVFSRVDEAVETTDRLTELYPDDPSFLNMHAAALLEAGEFDQALASLERSLEIDPTVAATHLHRADVMFAMRRSDETARSLDEAARLFELVGSAEGLAVVGFRRAQLLVAQARYDEVGARLHQAVDALLEAGNAAVAVPALRLLAEVELMRGDAAASAGRLLQAEEVAREAGNLQILCDTLALRGVQLHQTGDLAGAERLYQEAIDTARQLENRHLLVDPLSNLAILLSSQGRNAEAREILEESIELARDLDRLDAVLAAQFLLADIQYQLGEIDEAVRSYHETLEEASGVEETERRFLVWIHLGLAEIHDRQGKLALALEATERALEASRSLKVIRIEGYALARNGQIISALGRQEEAFVEIERARAIAEDPDAGLADLVARAVLARGVAYGYAGDWRAASVEAERALALPGTQIPALTAPALALACEGLFRTGRTVEAPERCRRAVDTPGAPVAERAHARAVLAEALAHAKRPKEARREALLALDEAERMGLYVPQVRAAVVLLGLASDHRPENTDEIRASGRQALDAYVASAPENDREALRRRADVREWHEAVSRSTHKNKETATAGVATPAEERGG